MTISSGKRRFLVSAFAVAAAAVFAPAMAQAESPAEFYKGKTIRLITSGSVGGGYDSYIRMIGPHLAEKLDATVVPINMPGGSHMLAINHTYKAKPDGLTLLLANGEAAILGQLLKFPAARFDLLKVNWLAGVNGENRVFLLSAKSKYKSLQDAINAAAIKFGSTGKADGSGNTAAIMSHALGLHSKIVMGYKGSREFVRAALQGEVDGVALSETSAKRFSRDGKLKPVIAIARHRLPLFKDVPTIFEAVKLTKEQAWWVDYQESLSLIGRSLMTGPGVPADRVAFLRKTLKDILTDPKVQEEAKKRRRFIIYVEPKDLNKYTKQLLGGLSPERYALLKKVLVDTYYE